MLVRITSEEKDKKHLLADNSDLAFAAGKDGDTKTLNDTAKRVADIATNGNFDTEHKEQAYFRVAQAYRACQKSENHKEKVFFYTEEALAVDKLGKSKWRLHAAKDARVCARPRKRTQARHRHEQESEIACGKNEADGIRRSAERNRDAFVLLLTHKDEIRARFNSAQKGVRRRVDGGVERFSAADCRS